MQNGRHNAQNAGHITQNVGRTMHYVGQTTFNVYQNPKDGFTKSVHGAPQGQREPPTPIHEKTLLSRNDF